MAKASFTADRELWAVARLAFGFPLPGGETWNWERLFQVATEQRLGMLIWMRSGSVVRDVAPRELAARWRAFAFAATERARSRISELREMLDTLGSVGVKAVVVKGLPLSMSLYGDPAARLVADTDLYIPSKDRAIAHAALLRERWVHICGDMRAEGTYRRDVLEDAHFLEVHSTLLDDNIVAHLRVPLPDAKSMNFEGAVLATHHGPPLPVFLAVHLAKHPHVPMLWWIDFATLWAQTGREERRNAAELARKSRLGGFLEWAIAGSEELSRISSGSEAEGIAAIARLRDRHRRAPVARVAALAARTTDRARILLAWALPRSQRKRPLVLARETLARGWRWSRRSRPETRVSTTHEH